MSDPGWDKDNVCVSILGTGQIVGVSFIAQSGIISTVAVLIFAALVVRNVVQDRLKPGPAGPQPLIRTHIDGYMISLMFADLLQGLGAIMSAKWASEGRVYCSPFCTAQGAIQQLGETGVALSTLAITVHTFMAIFFRWEARKHWWIWVLVVSIIWSFLLAFVLAGYLANRNDERRGDDPFYGPTPYWCWINESFLVERIMGEYFWLWFCAILNILLYIPLFFTLRGNIEVDPTNWRRIRFHRRSRSEGLFARAHLNGVDSHPHIDANDAETIKIQRAKNKEAMKMFWYPLSYTLLVLPLSIKRWSTFSHNASGKPVAQESVTATAVVLYIFGLSGLINVLLFMLTRPNLLLFNQRRERRERTSGHQHHVHSGSSFVGGTGPHHHGGHHMGGSHTGTTEVGAGGSMSEMRRRTGPETRLSESDDVMTDVDIAGDARSFGQNSGMYYPPPPSQLPPPPPPPPPLSRPPIPPPPASTFTSSLSSPGASGSGFGSSPRTAREEDVKDDVGKCSPVITLDEGYFDGRYEGSPSNRSGHSRSRSRGSQHQYPPPSQGRITTTTGDSRTSPPPGTNFGPPRPPTTTTITNTTIATPTSQTSFHDIGPAGTGTPYMDEHDIYRGPVYPLHPPPPRQKPPLPTVTPLSFPIQPQHPPPPPFNQNTETTIPLHALSSSPDAIYARTRPPFSPSHIPPPGHHYHRPALPTMMPPPLSGALGLHHQPTPFGGGNVDADTKSAEATDVTPTKLRVEEWVESTRR